MPKRNSEVCPPLHVCDFLQKKKKKKKLEGLPDKVYWEKILFITVYHYFFKDHSHIWNFFTYLNFNYFCRKLVEFLSNQNLPVGLRKNYFSRLLCVLQYHFVLSTPWKKQRIILLNKFV